jgi:hypothetical protein
MSERGRKGQAFILILVVLIGLIVIFALVSTRSARVSSAPNVLEAFWKVDGQRVTTVSVGDNVEAHVIVKATGEYVGSIVMKIRKDVSLWPDSDYSVKTVPVSLRGSQQTELELTFVPDEARGGGLGGLGKLRGYFIEVDFSAAHTDWVMESSYPPRLNVT